MPENNEKDLNESIIKSKILEAKLDELFEMAVEMDVSGLDSFEEIKKTTIKFRR